MSGIIELDSAAGRALGFTPDKFDGYLWRVGGDLYVSVIISLQPGQGNLSRLFSAARDAGLRVKVPTPFAHMRAILEKKGFAPTLEEMPHVGHCEVWVAAPLKEPAALSEDRT